MRAAFARESFVLLRDVQEGVVCHRLAIWVGHVARPSGAAEKMRVEIDIRKRSRLDMAILCRADAMQAERFLYISSLSPHAAVDLTLGIIVLVSIKSVISPTTTPSHLSSLISQGRQNPARASGTPELQPRRR